MKRQEKVVIRQQYLEGKGKMQYRIEHIFEELLELAQEFDQGKRKPKRLAQDIVGVIESLARLLLELVQ